MANIIVTSTDDNTISSNGFMTLRKAIILANTNGDESNEIILDAATYALSFFGQHEDDFATGSVDVSSGSSNQTLTIRGAGQDVTFIDANAIDRVFDVFGNTTLILADLTITDGQGDLVKFGMREKFLCCSN
ncbi:MAG: hypothetical protein J7641_19125 [Cyanobacteria bacterium SID2]|nr:hypothetical protein [Cyanobacteria bacterium SID2]MBP0006678.1 hypothetical protein [Cyanobacteria bacterium SBC]